MIDRAGADTQRCGFLQSMRCRAGRYPGYQKKFYVYYLAKSRTFVIIVTGLPMVILNIKHVLNKSTDSNNGITAQPDAFPCPRRHIHRIRQPRTRRFGERKTPASDATRTVLAGRRPVADGAQFRHQFAAVPLGRVFCHSHVRSDHFGYGFYRERAGGYFGVLSALVPIDKQPVTY